MRPFVSKLGTVAVALLAAACSNGPASSPQLQRANVPASETVRRGSATVNLSSPIDRVVLHAARGQRGRATWPKNGNYVYVSMTSPASGADEIDVLKQGDIKGSPVATITNGLDGSMGLFVDARRNLWVANAGGFILEYPPGSSTPKKPIVVPKQNGYPVSVWVAADGTIYSITWQESGSIVSKRSPDGTWSAVGDSDFTAETSVIGDSQGDVFAAGFYPLANGGSVEWLPAGTTQWQSLGFPYIEEPGGLAFDFLDRLTIANGEVGNVFSFDWNYAQLQDAFRCYNCASSIAFSANGKRLWAITASNPSTLEQFQFPGGRRLNQTTFAENADVNGMALSPAFAPPYDRHK
ncbi:MAG TPA: hypothetical protein VGF18_01895 [Candidatus Tumulicola sp.]